MLERRFLLPNHDFKTPNPKIPWKEWNLKVPVTQRPWPKGKKYISVNNFGFGGTNGHVVLEAAPFRGQKAPISAGDDTPEKSGQGRKLYVVTANDKASLSRALKNIVIYLEQRPEIFQKDLTSNLAYTLGQRRSLLQSRAAIPALNSFELIEAINGEKFVTGKETEPLRIGFILTGQGAQWYGMGRELIDQYPVFAKSIQLADQCLIDNGADWSLLGELFVPGPSPLPISKLIDVVYRGAKQRRKDQQGQRGPHQPAFVYRDTTGSHQPAPRLGYPPNCCCWTFQWRDCRRVCR